MPMRWDIGFRLEGIEQAVTQIGIRPMKIVILASARRCLSGGAGRIQ